MGFDISWSLHRSTGLDAGERDLAAAHVARWRNRVHGYDLALPTEPGASPGELVAWSTLRPSHGDPRRSDHGGYLLDVVDQVLEALTELRALFDDVEVRVTDDFSTYGWDDDHWEPFQDDAEGAAWPERRDGWLWAASLPAVPQPRLAAAAALLAAAADPPAIATALRLADEAIGGGPAVKAAWMDALAARLALDAWEPRPWTAELLAGLVTIDGRSGWRTVALAADAGLDGAAAALGRLADYHACTVLGRAEHPAWRAFAALLGHPLSGEAKGSGDLASLAASCEALARVGEALRPVPRSDDDDYKPGGALPAAVLEAVAAFAEVARPLGLEHDDDTRPALAPAAGDDVDDLDNALDDIATEVLCRLSPFLVGSLDAELRQTWRRELVALAAAPRQPLALEPERVDVPRAWVRPSPPVPERNVTTGLASLDEVARIATPPAPPSPWRDDEADDLLTMACKRDVRPDATVVVRLALPAGFAAASWSDQEDYLVGRLAALDAALVVGRVLDRCEELLDASVLDRVLKPRIAEAAGDPALAARLVEVWDAAFAGRWKGASGLARLFGPAAAVAPLFDHALEEIGAPDREASWDRSSAAFDLVGHAAGRAAEAAAVLMARARADRHRIGVDWRHLTYGALRDLAPEVATATAILELGEAHAVREAESLLILIARDAGTGIAMLERAVDLPHLAVPCARVLRKVQHPGVEPLRRRWLEHPFWEVRLAAAGANRDGDTRRAELIAVWAQIDHADIPMSDDERRRDAPDGPIGRPVQLLPLPPLTHGLASRCADHRRGAIAAVDALRRPADAPALVLADELDRALQRRGHRRQGPGWWRWRDVVPELPLERRARVAWAAAHPVALPAALALVRDEGADVVAATFPPPHLGGGGG